MLKDCKEEATGESNPLVREITFENAEELTEEGLPFLILFHHPDDTQSVKDYNDLVKRELMGEKSQVTFLTADGVKFAHPLHHLGKSKDDLPLIAIDSFRHMYLFPKYSDTKIPGKVKQFLGKLYSGQLHREFHYGPDEDEEAEPDSENVIADSTGHIPRQDDSKDRVKRQSGPVDSTFQKEVVMGKEVNEEEDKAEVVPLRGSRRPLPATPGSRRPLPAIPSSSNV